MIHVVTVHFMDDRWIGPQLRFLQRNLTEEFQVWACLNGIEPGWQELFHASFDLEGKHADKLNELARIVTDSGAAPDDLLLFLDGDAFPIAPVGRGLLNGRPLAAVRQDECNGDRQPHPCFCLTTVGFWNEIGGDWRQGYQWEVEMGGTMTDVGGNLLGILERGQIEWEPLLRSNSLPDEDPMLFGIYADTVYHHGAGFRVPEVAPDAHGEPADGAPGGVAGADADVGATGRSAGAFGAVSNFGVSLQVSRRGAGIEGDQRE